MEYRRGPVCGAVRSRPGEPDAGSRQSARFGRRWPHGRGGCGAQCAKYADMYWIVCSFQGHVVLKVANSTISFGSQLAILSQTIVFDHREQENTDGDAGKNVPNPVQAVRKG